MLGNRWHFRNVQVAARPNQPSSDRAHPSGPTVHVRGCVGGVAYCNSGVAQSTVVPASVTTWSVLVSRKGTLGLPSQPTLICLPEAAEEIATIHLHFLTLPHYLACRPGCRYPQPVVYTSCKGNPDLTKCNNACCPNPHPCLSVQRWYKNDHTRGVGHTGWPDCWRCFKEPQVLSRTWAMRPRG